LGHLEKCPFSDTFNGFSDRHSICKIRTEC
jgi:hypothetical protein